MTQALVLGAGFGGLAAAHELRRRLPETDEVTVVAASRQFFVGFAKLWDIAGRRPLSDGSRPLELLEAHGIRYVNAEITGIDAAARTVQTSVGDITADGMVVALGAGYAQGQRAMLDGAAGAHNLYDATELPAIRAELADLTEGRLLVSILGAPYLCPPAPFEAALLLDEWLRAKGRREAVDVVVTTPHPLTLPVAGPDASHFLAQRLAERDVTVLTKRKIVGIADGTVTSESTETLDWNLLLGVPAAAPPPVLADTGLTGDDGWIRPDPRTFATSAERVYAVGDCTLVPTATAQLPKAGVFAEAEGTVAAANLAADLHGGERATFDGHGFCYLELPGEQVAKVEGDFYAEPAPDVALTSPNSAAFAAKQKWEADRLAGWLG